MLTKLLTYVVTCGKVVYNYQIKEKGEQKHDKVTNACNM